MQLKDQNEGFLNKFTQQAIQKDNIQGRISELRYIIDQYKDELREMGFDVESELLTFKPQVNQSNKLLKANV